MDKILLVFAGGGVGSVLRYLLGTFFSKNSASQGFPWPTFIANTIACIIFALVIYVLKGKLSQNTTLLLTTGFCGGLSTFSAFSYESVEMLNRNQFGLLALYVGASVILCVLSMMLIYRV